MIKFSFKNVTLTFDLEMALNWYQRQGFTRRKTQVKHESSTIYYSRAMANVKVFCEVFCGQTDKQTGQKLYAPSL